MKPQSSHQRIPTEPGRSPAPCYYFGLDSLPQEGVPKGKLEGPFLFRSQIFANTVRKYWLYVPAQYTPDKPACGLVYQDGQRAVKSDGVLRVPQVMENLIAKKEMPVTIGVFITAGARGEDYVEMGGGNPNNRVLEYESLGDTYVRFVIEEMLPEAAKICNFTKNPEGWAIAGASSGAMCAFMAAWERPNQFRKVISCIGTFNDACPKLVREGAKKPIRIFLEDTFNHNCNPGNPHRKAQMHSEAMAAALREKGYDMTFVYGEGTHADDHASSIMPDILRWLWRDYPK